MNIDKFAQQIEDVPLRTLTLDNRVNEPPQQQDDLLAQAFEELSVAFEELRQQNEHLAIAHQQLEAERQRYRELFDFAPDGYVITDTNGKIIEANHTAVNLLKVSQRFLIGKLLINFIPKNERQAFRRQLQQLHNIERMQEWEISLQPQKGNKFYACISVTTRRDDKGNPVGRRWLLRDITARKQAEQQLRSIQIENLQLQEANRIKSQLVTTVSHELRTPMNVILGFSQLLLRGNDQQLSARSRNMVERIISSGNHLMELIDDILDFSKLEALRLELKPQEFNLVELVTKTTKELRTLAQQKNLSLVTHTNIQNPIVVNDRDRTRQVLVNLLDNAIKFTETGDVLVEVQQLNQDRVALIIKDTGIGIPEAELKNIFQEFWQLNQTTTRTYGGTGLGLAIVNKLVRLMKGTITVESKLGEGSTFRVELPRDVTSNRFLE